MSEVKPLSSDDYPSQSNPTPKPQNNPPSKPEPNQPVEPPKPETYPDIPVR